MKPNIKTKHQIVYNSNISPVSLWLSLDEELAFLIALRSYLIENLGDAPFMLLKRIKKLQGEE